MATVGNGCELARLLLTLLIKIKIMNKNEFISESNLSVEPHNVSAPNQCDHKITLLNGNTLQCYPKPDPRIGLEYQRELFINNAFLLWENRELILSDSRMFLCPIIMDNIVRVVGETELNYPVLGVYIEWWQICNNAIQTDSNSKKKLVYYISGAPLSRFNRCSAICDDGTRVTISLDPFSSYWFPFMKLCLQYNAAKQRYQAYTLQEVLEKIGNKTK